MFVYFLVGWCGHLFVHFYRPFRSWRSVWLSLTWRTQPWSELPRHLAVLTLLMRKTWMPRLCMTGSFTWKPGFSPSTSSLRGLWILVVIKFKCWCLGWCHCTHFLLLRHAWNPFFSSFFCFANRSESWKSGSWREKQEGKELREKK